MQGNVDKLQKLAEFIIFDVFVPELTDAARERAHHMLQAGPPADGEIQAADIPKKTRGRKAKVTTETLKNDFDALLKKFMN